MNVANLQDAAPVTTVVFSVIITNLFDLHPYVVLMAFIGAWIGIALRDAVPDFATKQAAIKHFCKTLAIVVIATILTAWAIPIILKWQPGIAQKSVAGFTSLLLVYFYAEIIDFIKFLFGLAKKALTFKFGNGGQ